MPIMICKYFAVLSYKAPIAPWEGVGYTWSKKIQKMSIADFFKNFSKIFWQFQKNVLI